MKYLTLIVSLLLVTAGYAQSVTISGSQKDILEITPEKNTGLDAVFISYNGDGLSAEFVCPGTYVPKWYRYSNLGGGFAEEINTAVSSSGRSTLEGIQPGYGYIVEYGDNRYYFYLIDYSLHRLTLTSLEAAAEQDCTSTILNLEAKGEPLTYYTINGQQRSLDRGLMLEYNTEEWNESSKTFEKISATHSIANVSERIILTPPVYSNTFFTLKGDKFLQAWNEEQSIESPAFNPVAIDIHVNAEQVKKSDDTTDDNDSSDVPSNEIKGDGSDLGGSAPAEINFTAECTEAVVFQEWQMASDAEFENITYRLTGKDLNYTFTQEGTVYVRFAAGNNDGSCEMYSDPFTVSVGATELYCPNAFSPGASEGVNDEWKVSYKSLIDFQCWIFDRYGTQMCYFDDPSKGWDGKYRGKLVKPGVYYYVIQATGSDGKKIKKSGDINIIRYRMYSTGNENGGDTTE